MENIKRKRLQLTTAAIHLILITFCALCAIPLLLMISISFSNESDISRNGFKFIPENFDIAAYKYIFNDPSVLLRAYLVTIFVTVVGAVVAVLMSASLGYVLSRQDYKYRKATTFYIFFTMLFHGGLVPWYMVVAQTLHLKDTIFALIVPGIFSAWNMFLMRTFFSSIHSAMIESAKIDGARELRILFSIILPVSKPALATVGLFYAISFWNDWWLSLVFIDNSKLFNLQYLLYQLLTRADAINSTEGALRDRLMNITVPTNAVRMGVCLIAAGPMLFSFPFFQKYFVKGLTIGSIKG